MRRILIALAVAAPLLLSGCLYRQPIFQGNLLEQKNVEQLATGMSKRQVFALLGSPSVADPFRQNRWDYVSSEQRGHDDAVVKIFTVHFEGDSLTKWEGEYFAEADSAMAKEQVERFGPNLARDKDKDRRGR
ncbi:outer membrane protein assembly factor BamE [Silanimonas sp.]|jgi:outer membrane protein assembly factor BamE|uniref:outer membrane protein assembly factor BamE n=1 Tax=Silanimonas sp. TaxID=1929290 RepID=UPI0022CB55BB|nr:outer membrane protein assembly factor BamE [Silanimonas sp.]MCZ8062986.1 outer membrane protein assembly factor BamE [Silanimonas sp.]MCZ8113471.1 outer membrane protein assembly factor BamE [Silanimonas sp.]MCZ8167310.1 outer membrane protein assembly factor BamE [Silanimonas sp.]